MRLSAKKIKEVCKLGQGAECCRYLVCGVKGFECAKFTENKSLLDNRVYTMTAKGDNCPNHNQ